MNEADIQQIEDGRLISELEGLDAAEARVDIDSGRQFGQQSDRVLYVAVQIDWYSSFTRPRSASSLLLSRR